MALKNTDEKKEKRSLSKMFLSESENKNNTYDDVDYIVYDEYEEADIVLIPIEEGAKISEKADKKQLSVTDVTKIPELAARCCDELGAMTLGVVTVVLRTIFEIVKIPLMLIWQKLLLNIAITLKNKTVQAFKRMRLKDFKRFRKDAKDTAKEMHRIRKNEDFKTLVKNFFMQLRLSFKKHRRVWLSVANVVFPIVCILVALSTFGAYTDKVFALQVTYNGQNIGYVENEDVYNKAKEQAAERLSIDDADTLTLDPPTYQIKLLTLNKLSDSKTICDKIIENTDGNYINACGIYVDGEFICAVKNEADARNVFEQILEPYKEKAGNKATVAFVEEISYQQGFYPDTENVVWDTAKLKSVMTSTKSAAVYHTVKAGDSLSKIASDNHMYLSELLSYNPKLTEDSKLHVGDKLVISNQVNYIRVKVMKTEKRTVSIDYETETKESSTLYKGQSKVVQEGKKGKERITEMVTYIDGVRSYVTEISSEVITKPTKEIIYKGTKQVVQSSYYSGGNYSSYISGNGNTSYSGGKLAWPSTRAKLISSPYGYRSRGFHGGLDLCAPGGSRGVAVLAAAGGTVVSAGWHYSYGYNVLIDHGNGLKTRYAHMQAGSLSVKAGQKVSQGQQIGKIGDTGYANGAHLHFEVIKNGSRVNPLPYLQ